MLIRKEKFAESFEKLKTHWYECVKAREEYFEDGYYVIALGTVLFVNIKYPDRHHRLIDR